ncbi:hypothetical protein LX97_00927 [Nonlabens dokdonensis]|uniref:Uncharacterized protein n=2 Tax=Nonlabens dokdonensis TaxID=328515 RepID=L7W3V7_NONDD|nr:hypothetical protein [Nonlabens dokdonensis]AGC76260.1 hypothetical protein DDD_1133 [Nonlabens dokdonensis DSW-6]PZX43922.1 hypothetical protein LX97_00927 [Nonlabens dokdonensis]
MLTIKNSSLYNETLKELNYSFGNFYFFDGFVVSEIKEGVDFSWELAKPIIQEVESFYNTKGSDIVYISNRVNSYNVKPVDWLKFTAFAFKLKGYAIVVDSHIKGRNAKFESLFIPVKFKVFDDLVHSILWAAHLNENHKQLTD